MVVAILTVVRTVELEEVLQEVMVNRLEVQIIMVKEELSQPEEPMVKRIRGLPPGPDH